MAGNLEIGLVARNDRYDDDDPRWLAQTATPVHDLRQDTGPVRVHRTPVPGAKGAVDLPPASPRPTAGSAT